MDIGRGLFRETNVLHRRYRLIRLIGTGTDGAVWESKDLECRTGVAIKVFHDRVEGRSKLVNAMDISHILHAIAEDSARLLIKFHGGFVEINRWCAVSALFGMSLRKVLDNQETAKFQSCQVRFIALQVTKAVAFMHRAGVIHTDIKPDNVVLVDDRTSNTRYLDERGIFCNKTVFDRVDIMIVDFDDAFQYRSKTTRKIGTGRYRAPEVTLGIPWDFPVDAFSVGCLIAELHLGRSLFHSSLSVLERLASIEAVLGLFPIGTIRATRKSRKNLFKEVAPYRVNFPSPSITRHDDETEEAVARVASLSHISLTIRHGELGNLVRRLLCLDAGLRLSLSSAVWHGYFYNA